MRTVRTRGPRRRGDNHGLVRSVPAGRPATPPPIPLLGYIERTMKLDDVADYEGLSDTSWSSGTTGNYSGVANTSWNCLYHHFVVPNRRDDNLTFVMDPIRYSCDAPASNGGTYDWWYVAATTSFAWYSSGTGFFGTMAISEKLLASGSHGEPNEGYLLLGAVPNHLIGASGNAFNWATLNAISAAVPVFCSFRVVAIQHRVNGSAVDGLKLSPPSNVMVGTDWRVTVAAGDVYELDVWYEVKYTANPFLSAVPGKCCLVIPQTRVLNGSRRPTSSMPTTWRPQFRFSNVNWNTAYDRLIHTYNVTIAGHVGWTLKGGSDGPHKMITIDGWTATFSVYGSILWVAPSSHQYVESIELQWSVEIPVIRLKPKAVLLSALGWSGVYGASVMYRPRNSGDYRNSTIGTDHGGTAINSSPCGLFSQSGSTTWDIVPKSTGEGASFLDGYRGLVSAISDLPLTFVTARTTQ